MNLELANSLIQAGLQEAKKMNFRMCIAVVDSAGHLVSFSSGDEETNSLTNVFNAMDYYSEYFFWVGLRQSDEQDDGGYYWSDDTPYDYSFFASMLFLMTCDMTCDSRIDICNFYLLLFFRWPTRYPWWLRQLCH